MRRLTIRIVLFTIAANLWSAALAAAAEVEGTKYLSFQLMTGIHGYAGPPPLAGQFSLGKSQLTEFVQAVVKAIGTTGDARHRLGFAVGPLCFDMSDNETRRFIRDSFAVARENDVAVAFHIDDSMSWGQRKIFSPTPTTSRLPAGTRSRVRAGADWGPKPTRFPPQMCFNSPAVVAAVRDRAGLIGEEIRREAAALKSQGKEHLFAGVIAGWETCIGRDFETGRPLGYRALQHRGFSAANPPQDPDLERAQIVKEFMELWANALHSGGVPRDKIFCHIAFTDQGLRRADATESYAVKVHFALPEVAFSSAYRPGFSTYPEGATFKEVHAALARHGSPAWISAEGVNVSPTSMPGESTMETYLGRMFNHGAVMVNIFAWGVGGEANRDNFFRRATENPEALSAYGQFLRHRALVESASAGFSSEAFQKKIHRLQAELPGWVRSSGKQATVKPLTEKLSALIKDRQWEEADKVVDALLALISGDKPTDAPRPELTVMERLPRKIQDIQKKLPVWVDGDANRQEKATTLMKTLDGQLKAGNLEAAEKTADSLLKVMAEGAADRGQK